MGTTPHNGQTADPRRFAPKVAETSKIRATRFSDLCKSCGSCILKCPVNAISWHPTEKGMLGEPGVFIDLEKCIGCEMCERACPDHAIEITNKRLESKAFSSGLLGLWVRLNAFVIERMMSVAKAPQSRLKQVGRTPGRTLAARVLRFFLMYRKEPVTEYEIK